MGEHTGIEWATATWNPWQGCTPRSIGCQNCYMARDKRRYQQDPWTVIRSKPRTFRMPLSKTRVPAGARVFVCSWSDFWHEDVPIAWRDEALGIMAARPEVTFLVPTKRPAHARTYLAGYNARHLEPLNLRRDLPHVWLGVSVENQVAAELRIPELLGIPAGLHFVSAEPLLHPIDISEWLGTVHADQVAGDARDFELDPTGDSYHPWVDGISWVIAGGESGPAARTCSPGWLMNLHSQCEAAGAAFFCKQLGGWPNKHSDLEDLPERLRVRDFPKVTA